MTPKQKFDKNQRELEFLPRIIINGIMNEKNTIEYFCGLYGLSKTRILQIIQVGIKKISENNRK